MQTLLFKIVGTQPNGLKDLRLEILYRVHKRATRPDKAAADLARNYWEMHDVKMTRFEVFHFVEPQEDVIGMVVGLVYIDLTKPSSVFNFIDGQLVQDLPE